MLYYFDSYALHHTIALVVLWPVTLVRTNEMKCFQHLGKILEHCILASEMINTIGLSTMQYAA